MGQLINSHDWSQSSLGPLETWPPSLKTSLGLMLGLAMPAVLTWGDDFLLFYNDAVCDLLGDRHPDALGRPAGEGLPGLWARQASHFEKVMRGEGSLSVRRQWLHLAARGSAPSAQFDFSFSPVPAEDGAIGGVFVAAAETTEGARAVQALEETQDAYRQLIEVAPAAIYEFDFQRRRYISVNDAMCSVTGYSREELLAMDPLDLLDEEGRAAFETRLDEWIAGATPPTSAEYRVITRDGDVLDVLLEATYTRDQAGMPLGATVVGHDITARRREERRVSRYNDVLLGINNILGEAIRAKTEEELASTCLEVALQVTGSHIGFIGTLGPDGHLYDVAISEIGWAQCQMSDQTGHGQRLGSFPLTGLYGRVIDEGTTLLSNTPPSHPASVGIPEGHPPLATFLGVPLKDNGKTIGLIAVANRENGYGAAEREDLELLAPTVAEALLRQRAESARRQSEERLLFIASNMPDILFFQDRDLRYTWISNPANPLQESEIVGKRDADLLPPREAAQLTELKQEVLDSGEPTRAEIPLSPGGQTRWYEAVYAPTRDETGEIVGLVSYSREISDRKLAELALRQNKIDMARAQEVGQIGSWRLDVNRNVLRWSDECYRIFGVPKGTPLTYETFLATVHPDDRAFVDLQWNAAIHGQPYDIEHRVVAKGEVRWVREKAYLETDETGRLLSGFGITQDITDQRRTEEALRLERDKLRAVIENAGVGIGLTDQEGTTLSLNAEALRIHGFTSEAEMLATLDSYTEWYELHYPEGQPMPFEDWPVSRALRGEFVRNYDLLLRRRSSNDSRYVSYTVSPIYDSHGQLVLLVYSILDLTEAKKTETRLERERRLLQTIYDSIPVMLTIYDPELEEIIINRHVERVTGWGPEDTAETNLMELVYPDPQYRQEVAAYMQSLAPGFKDILMTKKDGKVVETSWANIRIQDGRQVGIGLDISERIRAEAALRRYADRLHILHEVDEAILAETSAHQLALAAVKSIQRLLSCAHASVVTYSSETQELIVLAAYSQSGHGQSNSGRRVPVDKAWEPVLAQLRRGESYLVADLQATTPFSPFIDHLQQEGVRAEIWEPILIGGSFAGMLGVGLDSPGTPSSESQEIVHELALQLSIGLAHARLYDEIQRYADELEHLVHQRTAALEATEARFRAIFEEAAIGIALADGETGTLLAANPALQEMLGYGETQLIGMTAADLLADGGQEADRAWLDIVARAADAHQLEITYRRNDGGLGEANVVLSLLGQGETEGSPLVLGLVEDITERKEAQQALIRTERLAIMGRMAASMAHEVNNPLQSVLGCLGLAVEAMEDGADAGVYMDVAMDELTRAARIVHQMRDLGRSEEGHRERVDIVKLVQKVMLLTQKQAQNQLVTMRCEDESDLPTVHVVRDHIQQVFLNLVLNAIEAMPDGGTLTIGLSRTETPAGVRVTFADTGVGIAPGRVDTMFEAFQTTKELGLGMGLYVSRNIVQEHGGRIDVESALGEGSTFTVWLPA